MTQIKSIDHFTLKSWLENDEVALIDVREPFEYTEIHIEKAINVPLSELLTGIHKIGNNILTTKIVLQCNIGARSLIGCQLLEGEGFEKNVWNLEGGIKAWKESGFQVVVKSRL